MVLVQVKSAVRLTRNRNFNLDYMYLADPFDTNWVWHKLNFKAEFKNINSECSSAETSCHNKVKEPSIPNCLLKARGRIVGLILFSKLLKLREMQTASSRIWTRVAVSISNDDNNYTTSASTTYLWINFMLSFRR